MNAFFQRPWLDSFLFAVALAVGLTPELLPMVVSVTLSRGALRMAKQRVIVKRLAAIQNLGSMVAVYLLAVEGVKHWFYQRFPIP